MSMAAVRYLLPAAVLLLGVVLFALEPNAIGLEGLAMAAGAALSLLLLNLLFRVGASGDRECDCEEAARQYFARHGRRPGE